MRGTEYKFSKKTIGAITALLTELPAVDNISVIPPDDYCWNSSDTRIHFLYEAKDEASDLDLPTMLRFQEKLSLLLDKRAVVIYSLHQMIDTMVRLPNSEASMTRRIEKAIPMNELDVNASLQAQWEKRANLSASLESKDTAKSQSIGVGAPDFRTFHS